MKRNHRSGFTLVEIIIVIIILGILAAVALPQITKNLDTARAAEAINFLGAGAKSVSDCYTITEDMTKCNGWNSTKPDMGLNAPPASVKFTYTWTGGASAADAPVLTAKLTAGLAADTIVFTYNTDGSVGKVYSGKFAKLDK